MSELHIIVYRFFPRGYCKRLINFEEIPDVFKVESYCN